MRARKGSEYDGGHRVPCFVRWPNGGLADGRDITELTAHIDLVPTLCSLCGLPIDAGDDLDGVDLTPLLRGDEKRLARTLCVDSQRVEHPEKRRNYAVLTNRWRLVNGVELYDMTDDPGQQRDVAAENPAVVKELGRAYEAWWDRVSVRDDDFVRIVLGAEAAPVVELTCHDWHPLSGQTPDFALSAQEAVAKDPVSNGFWAVEIEQPGRYEFRLRRRPAAEPAPINAIRAKVALGDATAESTTDPTAATAGLVVDLRPGPAKLTTTFTSVDGTSRGAYFVEARRLP